MVGIGNSYIVMSGITLREGHDYVLSPQRHVTFLRSILEVHKDTLLLVSLIDDEVYELKKEDYTIPRSHGGECTAYLKKAEPRTAETTETNE